MHWENQGNKRNRKQEWFFKFFLVLVIIGIFCGAEFFLLVEGATKGGATRDKAATLTVGSTLTGEVTAKEPEQWYIFTTEKGKDVWYQFICTSLAGTGTDIILYDEDFQKIDSLRNSGETPSEMSFLLDAGATYYLCIKETPVWDRIERSEFKVRTEKYEDDGADTMGKTDFELVSGKKYAFALQTRKDVDYFSFIAGAEQSEVNVGTDIKKGVKFWIYDEAKKLLANRSAQQDETKSMTVDTVKGKTYYICFKQEFPTLFGSKESAGDYTVLVNSGSKPDTGLMFTVTLKKGTSFTLDAIPQPSGKKTAKITWKSSKKTVASVDTNGKVTAIKKGTAVITVTVGELTEKIKIKVTD